MDTDGQVSETVTKRASERVRERERERERGFLFFVKVDHDDLVDRRSIKKGTLLRSPID